MSSNIDFTTMKRWVPDYANSSDTVLANNNGYHITQTGWVRVHVYGYSSYGEFTIRIFVNSKLVWSNSTSGTAPNGARVVKGDVIIQVAAGDIVTATAQNAEDNQYSQAVDCYQIPGKWV